MGERRSMSTSGTLNGKVALVTGGGRGIGKACALALAKAGADTIVCSRTPKEVKKVADEIRALSRKGLALTCDVTDTAQVQTMAEGLIDQFGAIDILVNNAGLGRSHRFLDHPDDLWYQMLAINLTSVYHVTKAFVP